jgi:hypothetical protein
VGTPCYLIEATGRGKLSLRRFGYGQSSGAQRRHACPEKEPWESGYRPGCDASTGYLEEIAYEPNEDGCWPALAEPSHRDRRWPSVCESCGQPFRHHEVWQANGEPIYRVTAVVAGAALEVGDEVPLRDAPAGAMWIAKWLPEWSRGFDGRGLIVRLPDGHDWRVDGEATNCTRKGDRALLAPRWRTALRHGREKRRRNVLRWRRVNRVPRLPRLLAERDPDLTGDVEVGGRERPAAEGLDTEASTVLARFDPVLAAAHRALLHGERERPEEI